jgi:glycosyltransferase involved in cell wall biosynthesis
VRVLHVNKYLYRRGGAEAYLLDLAMLQVARGDDVAFFGMAHPENPAQRYDGCFPSLVELEPPPPGPVGRARAVARMLWSTSSRRGLAEVIADFRPDVVHLHNIYHQLSPSVLAAVRAAGVPAVMTLHDYKLVCPSYQLLADGAICTDCVEHGFGAAVRRRCKDGSLSRSGVLAAESWLHRAMGAYAPVDVFISPSSFLARTVSAAGPYADRVVVVNHFVDVTTAVKVEPGGPLVFAGRLSPEKGVDVLIEALAELPAEVTLDVAGDGPERPKLERLADTRTPGRVRFHGRLPRQQLHELVRASSVSVVPSRWHENQPMAVLESFACGVPVVTTDLGGLPELVEDGVDGLTVPPNKPIALASALAELTTEQHRAFAMGRAGRTKVEQRYDPIRHLDLLEEVYAAAALHRRLASPLP